MSGVGLLQVKRSCHSAFAHEYLYSREERGEKREVEKTRGQDFGVRVDLFHRGLNAGSDRGGVEVDIAGWLYESVRQQPWSDSPVSRI
jgi:hypothetical protein